MKEFGSFVKEGVCTDLTNRVTKIILFLNFPIGYYYLNELFLEKIIGFTSLRNLH